MAVPSQPEYKGMEVFGKTLEGLSGGKNKGRTFHSGQVGDHPNSDRRTPSRSK